MNMNRIVIVNIEPSKQFSELCGFPYFIEKRVTVKELLENKMITEQDIRDMESGKEIKKGWKISNND